MSAEFITVKHAKSGGIARVPKRLADHWGKRGWKEVKTPAGVSSTSTSLPSTHSDDEGDEDPLADAANDSSTKT